jgi:hypothetical protein
MSNLRQSIFKKNFEIDTLWKKAGMLSPQPRTFVCLGSCFRIQTGQQMAVSATLARLLA